MSVKIFLPVGIHVSGELMGCQGLKDKNFKKKIKKICRQAVKISRATVKAIHLRRFRDGGITVNVELIESHLWVHTYTKYNGCFVDIFMCGEHCDPREGFKYIRKMLSAYGRMRVRKRKLFPSEVKP